MTKRVNRNHLRPHLIRLISGLFVGGVLLFQGTGYITSNVYGETNQNTVVVTEDGSAKTLGDTTIQYGIMGTGGATVFDLPNDLYIYNGTAKPIAVLGKLDESGTSLNSTDAVTATLTDGNFLLVGANDATTLTGYGTLIVAGTSTDTSQLILDNGKIALGENGTMIIGNYSGDDMTISGKGLVWLKSGNTNQINNAATATEGLGILIGTNGELRLGTSAEDLSTGILFGGYGRVENSGLVTVYNADGDENQATFYNYIDTAAGVFNATGKAMLGKVSAPTLTINGTVTAGELQLLASNKLDKETDSLVTINGKVTASDNGLIQVGDDADPDAMVGSSLTIARNATVTAGGLKIDRYTAADVAIGGKLTVSAAGTGTSSKAGQLLINGLENKFDASGAQTADGIYDVYLDYALANSGTITIGSTSNKFASGIAFTGDTGATTAVDGFTNSGTITAYSDLALYGRNATTATGKKTAITNSGSLIVDGDLALTYDAATTGGLLLNNSGTVDITSLTLDDANIEIANSSSAKAFYAHTLNLKNGSISGAFTGYQEEDADGEIVGALYSLTGTGEVKLTANTAFNTFSDSTAGLDENTTFHITDTAKMTGADYTLTLTNTDLVNDSALESDSAINVKTLIFGSGASYSGGKNIAADMTFNSGATFWTGPEEIMTLAADKDLTAASGSTISVDFNNNSDLTLNTLSGTGTANLASGSGIAVGNLSSLTSGSYQTTLIKTAATGNDVFASTLQTSDSIFYALTDNRADAVTTGIYQLYLDVKGFDDFAHTPNQHAVGENLDVIRTSETDLPDAFDDMIDEMMSFDSADDVTNALDALSGVDKANSLMLAMSNPWLNPFDRMQQATHRRYTPAGRGDCSNGVWRGQSEEIIYEDGGLYTDEYSGGAYAYDDAYGCTPIRSLLCPGGEMTSHSTWATFHHTTFNARTDGNSSKYGISRTGVTVGYDLLNEADTLAGLSFDYNQPYLYGTNHKINTGNFNLGLYGRREFGADMNLSVYVGGGMQQYTSKRTVEIGSLREYHKGDFNGGSVAAAIRLARDYNVTGWTILRPLVQFDTQHVWQDAFTEENGATALAYDKAELNRTFVRAGLETETNTQFFRFTGRALYAGLLSGDKAPQSSAAFSNVTAGNSMLISGVDLGSSFLDLGVGALGYLDCEYRWMISGNYDFAAGDKSNAHTGSVALSYFF